MITDEQIKQALESAGVEFQYFIHARTNKQVCTTAGSIDFNKIASGIRELIALAKQEPAQAVPVAWLDQEFMQAYTIAELADANGTEFKPLYTHPAPLDSDTRNKIAELCEMVIGENNTDYYAVIARYVLERLEAGE